ncbi:MAG: cysteine--tRNA ligase, partial [Victivallaceae bacterium]
VDDKTIRDSRAKKMSLNDFTAIYKKAFFDDLKTLNITPAAVYPAATEHVKEMIELIQTLMDKGFAYQSDDKCIYFSIERFPEYGKLARIDQENQISGVRIKNDEYAKESVADFALWKAYDENDGDVCWESPWGKGRPGWHIECSAMAMKYLGKSFDIHTGGVDNMFPHHEDEIAQSECANGCKYVNYWLHCAHLMVNGEKMSKSAGNFFTLRDLLDKSYTGREIRYVLLSAHYRKKLNFTFDSLTLARETFKKFDAFIQRLREADGVGAGAELEPVLTVAAAEFKRALGDDLNISGALAAVFILQRELNKLLESDKLSKVEAEQALDLFRKFDAVLGVLNVDAVREDEIPAEVKALAEGRFNARKNKDYAEADRCRNELTRLGYLVEDGAGSYRIKKL